MAGAQARARPRCSCPVWRPLIETRLPTNSPPLAAPTARTRFKTRSGSPLRDHSCAVERSRVPGRRCPRGRVPYPQGGGTSLRGPGSLPLDHGVLLPRQNGCDTLAACARKVGRAKATCWNPAAVYIASTLGLDRFILPDWGE